MSQSERRLAAIMFTDMVGFTAMGQQNESLSLVLLEEQRNLVRPILGRHSGREIKTIGDAFLVEFQSALEAVRCAYDIQRATREFNFSVSEDKRIHLRVGIHLGDVVSSGSDISGDTVNVASRIAPLAENGGVCLTSDVFNLVRGKFELPMESIGKRTLKNVSEPMEVFRISLPWSEERGPFPALKAKRIAILPFANMSPDPNDEYFADGMTEELIASLSGLKDLTVIARTSVMKYKASPKGALEIGRELNAGTLVEGSVRKAGNKVRITVQLVDALTEGHLWAQNYERQLDDIFAVQSEISEKVAKELEVKLVDAEKARLEAKPTSNTEAYALYLKGRFHWSERTKGGTEKAVGYLQKALDIDSDFASAYAGLADCLMVSRDYGWMSPNESCERSKELASKALGIDPGLAEAHATLGNIYTFCSYRWKEAENEFKQAIALKPSYATAHQWYALLLHIVGRHQETYEQLLQASDLDPLSRVIGLNVGWALLHLGRLGEAVQQFERVKQEYPDWANIHYCLGWAYFLQSRTQESLAEMRKSVEVSEGEAYYRAELACILGLTGGRAEAEQIIAELKKDSETVHVDQARLARALLGVGRTDEAFDHLEEAFKERSTGLLYFRELPGLKNTVNDPRWISLEERMGLRASV